jgi:nitroreductase
MGAMQNRRVRSTLEMLVDFAIKAPSAHNSQPWRFEIDGLSRIQVSADWSRRLPVGDPDGRELIISCGAALENLVVAARAFGLAVEVRHTAGVRESNVLAVVTLSPGEWPTDGESLLFDAVERRRTSREPFASGAVDPAIVQELAAAASLRGATLEIVVDADRRSLRDLVEAGDRTLFADAGWRGELASWIRTPRAGGDGLAPGHVPAPLVRLVVRSANLGKRVGATDAALADEAPVIAVLSTADDDRAAWLAAGRALERVLLTAERFGLRAGFLNQPCQVPELRAQLKALTHGHGAPQIVLRIGRPRESARQTPRRLLDEVVRESVPCGVPSRPTPDERDVLSCQMSTS